MSDWRIFQGNRKPHKGIERLLEVKPPGWRRFDQEEQSATEEVDLEKYWRSLQALAKPRVRDQQRGSTFRVRSHQQEFVDVVEAVNAALYLRRPLLIEGKPGAGKTSLAYAVAYELKLAPVLLWAITTRSTLQEGLYQYDAIARLQDAQLRREMTNPDPSSKTPSSPKPKDIQDIGQYIRLGPLGTAFLPSKYPRLLLIDEIDKSDLNLPNDLLNLFEEGEFKIPELVRLSKQGQQIQKVQSEDDLEITIQKGVVRCKEFPLIMMTSNGERDFPPAFLRRCLRVQMPDPTEADLAEIVKSHLGAEVTKQFEAIIKEFAEAKESEEATLATDQLLNTVYLLTQNADQETLKRLLFKPLTRMDDSR